MSFFLTQEGFLLSSMLSILLLITILPTFTGGAFPHFNISNDLSACTNITFLNFILSVPACILSPINIFIDYINILSSLNTILPFLGTVITVFQVIDIFIAAKLIRGV